MRKYMQILRYGDANAKINRHIHPINTDSASTPPYVCNFYRLYRFYGVKAYHFHILATALYLSVLTMLSEQKQKSAATFYSTPLDILVLLRITSRPE